MAFNADGDFNAPAALRTDEFLLRPLRAADAQLDYDAVMESMVFLRTWEQTGWPADNFTVEENREDVVRMEQRHNAGESFTYTVLDPTGTECLGCIYLFPPERRFLAHAQITALGGAQWSDYDVVVYFWVRQSRLADELDRRLLAAFGAWLDATWPGVDYLVVTGEPFAQQVAMLERAGWQRRFRFTLPDTGGAFLAYTAD